MWQPQLHAAVFLCAASFYTLISAMISDNSENEDGYVYDRAESERIRLRHAHKKKRDDNRDIGEIPEIVNLERRKECERDLLKYLLTYHPRDFTLSMSKYHLLLVKSVEEAILEGLQQLIAFPRGSGKTSVSRRSVQWGIQYGHIRYAMLFGAEASKAKQHIDSIKHDLLTNDLLLEDFPEVVFPMRKAEGIANRANYQSYQGKVTGLKWGGEQVCVTDLPQNQERGNARSVIGVGTITGSASRGPLVNGFRPDFVFLDDPQTRASASSPPQCRQRTDIVRGDIMGMAGPDKAISSVMTATVIYKDDMADKMLDRKLFPEWNGIRVPMVLNFPENMELWEQWNDIRRTSLMDGRVNELDIDSLIDAEEQKPHLLEPAHNFYRNNRTEMDKGAEVYWEDRIEPGDESATETAMKLYFRSPETFASEYQNNPVEDLGDESRMPSKDVLIKKTNRFERYVIPDNATNLVSYIDVQGKCLYYWVMAFENNFTGYVVDYNTWPDQNRNYFTLRDARKTIFDDNPALNQTSAWYKAMHECMDHIESREWRTVSGDPVSLGVGMIDGQGDANETVYQVTLERPGATDINKAVWFPSHGQGHGAKTRPFGEFKANEQTRSGPNWRIPIPAKSKKNRLYFLLETNFWKSFTAGHWNTPMGEPGAFSFWDGRHEMAVDHLHGEKMTLVRAKGREVGEWSVKGGLDQHWFDGCVGCCVGASKLGCTEAGLSERHAKVGGRKKKKITKESLRSRFGR